MSAYCASKAALEGLTRALALDLSGSGIRVNCVAPGLVATENQLAKMPKSEAEALPQFIPEVRSDRRSCLFVSDVDLFRMCISVCLQSRFASPEEIASLVVSLCSDSASYISGAIIPIDGGLSCRQPGPLSPS